MKKRIWALILVIIMVMNLFASSAMADGPGTWDGVHVDPSVCDHKDGYENAAAEVSFDEDICEPTCYQHHKGQGTITYCYKCGTFLWANQKEGAIGYPGFNSDYAGRFQVDFNKEEITLTCTDCGGTVKIDFDGKRIGEPETEETETEESETEETETEEPETECTHVYTKSRVLVLATCNQEGVQEYKCTLCGDLKTEPIPTNNKHLFDLSKNEVIPPTCTDQGYTKKICEACGREVHENYMPALGHKWDDGVETTPANCAHTGVITYTCARCEDTKEESIPINDQHSFTIVVEHVDHTCTVNGYTKYECEYCHTHNTEVEYAAHDYVFDSQVDPTCGATGSIKYVCSVCNDEKTETIPATGEHNWEVEKTFATCTDNGYTFEICTVCESERSYFQMALGHDWEEVTEPATCQAEGLMKKVCKRCGESEVIETIEKIAHTYGPDFRCTMCGETYPEIQALIDAIETLPALEDIDRTNALQTYRIAGDILEVVDNIKNGDNQELKAALALVDEAGTKEKYDAAYNYLIFSSYELGYGTNTFNILWNDNNNENEHRLSIEDFIASANIVLHYEIVPRNGGDPIATGTISDTESANAAFAFAVNGSGESYDFGNRDLYSIHLDGEDYKVTTSERLPVRVVESYIDYTTGITETQEFVVHYSIEFNNPIPEYYIPTAGNIENDTIKVANGEKAILTELIDWNANIIWYDDNNRSSNGGTSTENRPRVSADDIEGASTVYVYPMGYNVTSGTPVDKSRYDLTIDNEQTTISLTGLPAYDNEGNPLAYYLAQNSAGIPAANADVVPGNKYVVEYQNIGNVASKVNGVYNNGYIFETLHNDIPFTVTKVWADGRDESQRPNCKFYIWRITEDYAGDDLKVDTQFSYAVPGAKENYNVPKADSSTFEFVREIDGNETILFPMYDSEGRRYIYFGREKGLPGEYTSIMDFSTVTLSPEVVANYFANSGEGYFINGTTITNTLTQRVTVPVSKEFRALAIQNKENITATFRLQKLVDGQWVDVDVDADGIYANYADDVVVDKTNGLSVTLKGFSAEAMHQAYSGVSVDKYSGPNHSAVEFRWVETGVSVNGVSATYDPNSWVSNADGTRTYKGDIIVYDGQKSTVLNDSETITSGADDTTALFKATATGNNFVNTLIGDYQVDIKKYFYDENGPISADAEKMAGVTVTFQIYRDDEPFDIVTMTYDNLVPGQDYWEILKDYDRFDADGREYRFKVKETSATGDWYRTENYNVYVLEYPPNSDILLKRLETEYVNGPNPGRHLEFDMEKEWLDDSDIESRYPVVVDIYRFRDAKGNLLATPEIAFANINLQVSNNWYQKVYIQAADEDGYLDSVDNYIVLEKGIASPTGTANTEYNFSISSSSDLAAMQSSIHSGMKELGMTGNTANENANWDGINYRYRLFETYNNVNPTNANADPTAYANYLITNLRIGTQDYILQKTWKAGGTVKKAQFGLFQGNTRVGTFTLDVNDDDIVIADVVWADAYKNLNLKVEAYGDGAWKNNNGNIVEGIIIRGLPKFDEIGVQQFFRIDEIGIYKENGDIVYVNNGRVNDVDGRSYAVSVSSSETLAENEQHRSPDEYRYSITNSLAGSYDIVSNKVWRDNVANDIVRPDICFSVYRLSTKDATLNALITAGDVDGMSAYLSTKVDNDHRVITDRYWDTQINDYWWTCTLENMDQYDGNGYPYVYYAVESVMNNGSVEADGSNITSTATYIGYYCNETVDRAGYRPTNNFAAGEKITTKKVFGIENDELVSKDSANVFILADGINKGASYSDYYSATAVNRPENTRTVSGKKLWLLPTDWVIPDEEMPVIGVDLYRTLEEMSFSDYDSAIDYAEAIKENAVDGIINAADASFENKYEYRFTTTSDGQTTLDKFNEWGDMYYYYTLERPEWKDADGTSVLLHQNYPEDLIQYEDNDFNISNVFTAEPPYVEVSIKKIWQISDEVWAKIEEYGLEEITPELFNFASASITLKGIPTDSAGQEIEGATLKFCDLVINPMGGQNDPNVEFSFDEDATGQYAYILTARYTFKDYKNTATGNVEQLPYYWLNDYKINYYLEEKHTNGYEETHSKAAVVFDKVKTESDIEIHYNSEDEVYTINNTYNGEKTSYTFYKKWNDKYVDNDDYRPESVTFRIKRSVDGVVDEHYEITKTLTKADLYEKDGVTYKDTWSGTVTDLLKYAPNGKEYKYFVQAEIVGSEAVGNLQIAEKPGDEVGNYVFEYWNPNTNTLSNKLKDGVDLEATKDWLVEGQPIGDYETKFDADGNPIDDDEDSYKGFDDLRKLGLFPAKVQFVVQRKVGDGEFENLSFMKYLSDSNGVVDDSVHKITINGREYIGHEVDIASANATNYKYIFGSGANKTSMKWENLPQHDTAGNLYSYRVIERFIWDTAGTDVSVITGTTTEPVRGITATINENGTSTFTLVNDVTPKKVRLGKLWIDNNGSENTRPDKINMTIKSADTGVEYHFVLTVTGNVSDGTDNSAYYYTDYFYLPAATALDFASGKYIVTESYTAKNGAEYTESITDPTQGYDLIAESTGDEASYTFLLKNTYDEDRKTVNLDAYKKWDGNWEAYWALITRPQLKFKLQYKDRATGAWTDITDMSMFTDDAAEIAATAVRTLPITNTDSARHVEWKKLYKYWDDPSVDGVAELIEYRAIEVIDNTNNKSSYSSSAQQFRITNVDANDTDPFKVTITNSLRTRPIYVRKVWTKNGTTQTLTNDEVKALVALDALPKSITFEIQYKTADMTDYAPVTDANGNNARITRTTEQLLTNNSTGRRVPKYDSLGREISYRVKEVAVTYNTGTYDVVYNGDVGTIGSITTAPVSFTYGGDTSTSNLNVALSNDYAYVPLNLTKIWKDEDNRDGERKDIVITVSRDGSPYTTVDTKLITNKTTTQTSAANFSSVTATGNAWAIAFNYLPKYQSDKQPVAGNESVYTWAETTGVPGYGITYDADGSARTEVDNTYKPQRGSVTAVKNWVDYDDEFYSRCEIIYFKLQYKAGNGAWTDVQHKDLTTVNGVQLYVENGVVVADKAYTTSTDGWIPVYADAQGAFKATWNDLPVKANTGNSNNANVSNMMYRVVEGIMGEDGTITQIPDTNGKLNGYSVTYNNVTLTNDTNTNDEVKNELDKTTLDVEKVWAGDALYKNLVRPQSVTFTVEFQNTAFGGWYPVPSSVGASSGLTFANSKSYVTVTEADGWKKTISNLPKLDADGNEYAYRVTEVKISYTQGDAEVDNTLGIVGPYNVDEVVKTAVLDATGKYTVSATNTLDAGKVKVTKVWTDGDNRDGGQNEISVQLYRVNGTDGDQAVGNAVKLNAGNGYSYEWTGLPVRTNRAAGLDDLSEYYVKEIGEDGLSFTSNNIAYTVAYDDNVTLVTNDVSEYAIENTHIPEVINLDATKEWGDDQDKINVRPESIQFKIQYKVGNGSWTDMTDDNVLGADSLDSLKDLDATTVYMASNDDITQTISESNSWTASWHNLTANVLVDGVVTSVQYRAVEITEDIKNYEPQNDGISASVDKNSPNKTGTTNTKEVTITNDLIRGSITVSKKFTVNGLDITGTADLYTLIKVYELLPEELTVTLNYMDGTTEKSETGKITFNATTNTYSTCTFSDLPIADALGEKIVYTLSDFTPGFEFVQFANGVEVTIDSENQAATITNDYDAGSLKVTKIWDDDDNRDGGQKAIRIIISRDGVEFDSQVLSSGNAFEYTWGNLPVYQDARDAEGNRQLSVYTIKEDTENNGEFVGDKDVHYSVEYVNNVNVVKGETAEASVTNTHIPYTGSITVTKDWEDEWEGEDNFFGSRPERIELTLWYTTAATPTADSWALVNDGLGIAYSDADTPNPGYIYTNDSSSTYTWTGLPVNFDDGNAIKYKVVETPVPGYKTAVYSSSEIELVLEDDYDEDVTVTNTIDTTSITITKAWESIPLFGLEPVKATFHVQYKHGDSGWLDDMPDVDVLYGQYATIGDLPKADGNGDEYEYRVSEVSITYKDGDDDVTINAAGDYDENDNWSGFVSVYQSAVTGTKNADGSFVFEAANNIITSSLKVTKNWYDDNDRDGGRKTITIELSRDGELYDRVDLTAEDDYEYTWNELPVYRDDAAGNDRVPSVYSIKEVGEEDGKFYGNRNMEYTVVYSDVNGISITENEETSTSVSNTHIPLQFNVDALKIWNDIDPDDEGNDVYDIYYLRPDVKLELFWSVDKTNWTKVEYSDVAFTNAETGDVVSTSSPTTQELCKADFDAHLQTWTGAEWDTLPAYVRYTDSEGVSQSMLVYYQVKEIGELPESYTSTSDMILSYNTNETVTADVVNSLEGFTSLTVQKIFDDNDEMYVPRPVEITVKLQYATVEEPTEEDWIDIDEENSTELYKVLTLENDYSYTWTGLRDDYQYRSVEVSIAYPDDDTVILLESDTKSVTGQVGGYEISTEMNEDGTLTTITNKLIVGKIEVTKTWHDGNDRDGMRPTNLTFSLYRDDFEEPIAVQVATVTADGIEKCVFENIPVYKNASEEFSTYYVVETDNNEYTITYEVTVESPVTLREKAEEVDPEDPTEDPSDDEAAEEPTEEPEIVPGEPEEDPTEEPTDDPETPEEEPTAADEITIDVTNTHDSHLFNIEVTKTWDDNKDQYGLRPESVELKLQYALDPESEEWTDVTVLENVPSPAEDDGLVVFTTSDLIQTLTKDDAIDEEVWGTAVWENLPANVLVEATESSDDEEPEIIPGEGIEFLDLGDEDAPEGTDPEDTPSAPKYVSVPVYYRVVEVESPSESYDMIPAGPFCYDDALESVELTVTGTVTNPLVEMVPVEASKVWVDNKNGQLKKYIADKVTVVLQYKAEGADEWTNVPENGEVVLSEDNDWSYVFEELPAEFSYRVIEISLERNGKVYEMGKLEADNDENQAGRIDVFDAEAITVKETDEDGNAKYVTIVNNRLIDKPDTPKTGDDFNSKPYVAAMAASVIGMIAVAFVIFKRRREADAE